MDLFAYLKAPCRSNVVLSHSSVQWMSQFSECVLVDKALIEPSQIKLALQVRPCTFHILCVQYGLDGNPASLFNGNSLEITSPMLVVTVKVSRAPCYNGRLLTTRSHCVTVIVLLKSSSPLKEYLTHFKGHTDLIFIYGE